MSTEEFTAQEVYCDECDADYRLAWSDNREKMYVVCDCGKAETVPSFMDRFDGSVSSRDDGDDDSPRGYR